MRRAIVFLLSGALSGSTLLLAHAIKQLPYSQARDLISDAILLPGGLLAYMIYPAGVHEDGSAVWWAWATIIGNLVLYFGLWVIALTLYARRKRPH